MHRSLIGTCTFSGTKVILIAAYHHVSLIKHRVRLTPYLVCLLITVTNHARQWKTESLEVPITAADTAPVAKKKSVNVTWSNIGQMSVVQASFGNEPSD